MGGSTDRETRQHFSAGGAVLSVRNDVVSVPLIATRRRTRWGLPKGTLDEGETSVETAVREVREEIGLEAEVVIPLGRIEYSFRAKGDLIHKQVEFFLMRWLGGSIRPQLSEVDDAVWFTLEEAIRRESYDSEREILERARRFWLSLSEEEQKRYGAC